MLFIASHALAEAILPARAATLLRRLAPQPMGKIRLPGGISINSALLSFLSIALIVVFWVTIINPDRDNMKAARHEMCSGNLDFVFTLSETKQVAVMNTSMPNSSSVAASVRNAVQELAFGEMTRAMQQTAFRMSSIQDLWD